VCPFPKEPGPPDYGLYLCSPAELEASYNRCRALRVPAELDKPQKILPKTLLDPRLAENSLLLTAVERVITQHHYVGAQNDHIYILCDPELVALKIMAASEVLAAAEEAGVKPGMVFTEESCGTNALALAQEHKRVRAIRGEQHYCKLFKDWWCVAGPVKDPGGKILGYLDISMHAGKELGLTVALLEVLLKSIEREIVLLNHAESQVILLSNSLPLSTAIHIKLSSREQEILHLLLSGLTTPEVAKKLYLGITTVKTHRKHIYEKLGVSSLIELFSKFNR
jgi:transcriptional regulator of acetoin/glycerol metabolism